MEHVLSLPTVSRRALLLFWLVVLCVPLLFLRSSMVSLIREDERNLTEQARRALREEMTAFLDDLSLPKQILNSLRSVESRSSRLATLTGLKQLDSEQGIADLLLLELARELPAEPLFLLIDPGHGRPPEIRYNTRLFTPLSAPSRRLAELWLRSLKDVLSPEERQRLDRTVCNLLGELVSTNLPPDQVQESFSVRLGHERLLLAGRTLTETPTAPFRRWIIAFRDRDFRLTQIIRQAVSQSLRHQCRRQVRFSTTDESGATFDLTRAHLRYSLPMPRLLFAQGTDIPQRGIESPLPRPQRPRPLLQVMIPIDELRPASQPLAGFLDIFLVVFLGITLLWVMLPEWRPRLSLALTTKLYAIMFMLSLLPLLAFLMATLSSQALSSTLETEQRLLTMGQRLEMLESGLAAFSTTHQTRVRGFANEIGPVADQAPDVIVDTLRRARALSYVRWILFLRSDGYEHRTLFMDNAPRSEQKFQMETQAAMAGGLRTYLKDRQVYHETFIYPPGHKPPAKSIVSPATDFGKASVVELRQGSFLRTVYPNLEEVFFTFLILPASSTPTLPRATCAMLIDPREIVRQYLQELQAAPDQLLNQEADFRTEYRMYLYDPLQKRLLQGTDPNLAENDFTLIAQRTINAGQGVTQNLLHSPRSRLVQSRIFHGFPGVAVAIGTPVQSTSAGISASTFLIVLILFSLLIVLLMSRFLSEILVEPFQVFQHGVTRIARGEYGTGIFLDTRDEFQQLGQSFNQLSEELAQKERMKRFLSERIIRAVECDAPGPPQQIQEASILVSDLRGFTTLSERHPPEQITAMLNSYFTTMEEAIQEEGGFIDSFIGDCLVAVFLPVADATTPAHRSLRAGIAMRRRLAEFNRERRQRGEFLIDNGVGIAIGPIITGLIKSGFKRRELGILGEPVREAHRLETQTRKARCSGIVVSQRLQDQLAATWTFTPLPDSRDAWELSLDLPVEERTR